MISSKQIVPICLLIAAFTTYSVNAQTVPEGKQAITLKEAFADKFHIGTALNMGQLRTPNHPAIAVVKEHFNSIVAENAMKSMYLQPKEGEFDFRDADLFVDFGMKNGMKIIGHTLIWHSQAPQWFFVDQEGSDVSREVLTERMRNHINTVVSRYKGRIHGWDVVNEAVLDNGEWRKSKFYEIIGEDFFRLAFQFAQEADPEAELYYNDYNTAIPAKREGIARIVGAVLDGGGKVDAIGMQEHHGLHFPSIHDAENTIKAFADLGVKVMVTEMDISVLPRPRPGMSAEISETSAYIKELNPYTEKLPEEMTQQLGKRYVEFFRLYLKYQDKIDRVTLWGVGDHDSWLNHFPVRGRTDYPLLFDRNYSPKPFVGDIISLTESPKKQRDDRR